MQNSALQEEYRSKLCTADEAVRLIRSGQRVFIGSSCGEPQHLVNALLDNARFFSDVEIVRLLSLEGSLLSLMADQVQATLRSHSATTLRSSNGQRAFELLDELQRTLQGLRRGANPNRDILGDALLVRFGEVLGGLPRDGRISATTGDVGP